MKTPKTVWYCLETNELVTLRVPAPAKPGANKSLVALDKNGSEIFRLSVVHIGSL